MALRKKRKNQGKIEIVMSAMIDVVFLLLIYFIVTYTVIEPEAHLEVILPAPDTSAQPPDITPWEIEVYENGYIYKGTRMSLDRVGAVLAGATENTDPEDITLVIKTSVNAPVRNLVNILDICRAVDITNLNVMTLQ